jgi:hypothetical protein
MSTSAGDEVLAILLQQPSFCRDQHAVLQLLQASKATRAAVAVHCTNLLQLVVHRRHNALQQFVQLWLPRHAGLLQQLELQQATWWHGIDWTAAASQALSSSQLQSFALCEAYATANILQDLPAAHLTHLCFVTSRVTRHDMAAVAGLTALRSLEVTFAYHETFMHDAHALAPLAAGLQQLTELRIGPVLPSSLQYVPASVQQLDVTLVLGGQPQTLSQLAGWIKLHGSIVRSMVWLGAGPSTHSVTQQWRAAIAEVADALDAAGRSNAAALVEAAAAGGEDDTSSSSSGAAAAAETYLPRQVQLLSFRVAPTRSNDCSSITPVLQHLPTSTLTQLQGSIDWGSSTDLAAVCSLTALRSLLVINNSMMSGCALASLSSLQHLTALQLQSVRPVHLQQLPPWLQQLDVAHIKPYLASAEQDSTQQQQQQLFQLHLGHLTGLTALGVGARPSYMRSFSYESARQCNVITAESQLPPHLQELSWPDCSSTEPLLCLQGLQRLQLHRIEQQLSAAQLLQLCDVRAAAGIRQIRRHSRISSSNLAAPAGTTWAIAVLH